MRTGTWKMMTYENYTTLVTHCRAETAGPFGPVVKAARISDEWEDLLMKDGGPAFARAYSESSMGPSGSQAGATLRDYFAAAALTGLMASGDWSATTAVQLAFEISDVMIVERDR